MKLINYRTFKATISSQLGNFMQEIYMQADNIDEAVAIGKEFAESIGGELSGITRSYMTCVKSSTKTITVEV